MKKIRFWLYKVRFIIEIDANTLITQLNCFATNLPNALITCWLIWIRFFDFDVHYIFDKKYIAINSLLRQSRESFNNIDEANKENIDNFIDNQLNCVRVCFAQINTSKEKKRVLEKNYSKKSKQIARYLISLQKSNISQKKFRKFRNYALHFLVREKRLFR